MCCYNELGTHTHSNITRWHLKWSQASSYSIKFEMEGFGLWDRQHDTRSDQKELSDHRALIQCEMQTSRNTKMWWNKIQDQRPLHSATSSLKLTTTNLVRVSGHWYRSEPCAPAALSQTAHPASTSSQTPHHHWNPASSYWCPETQPPGTTPTPPAGHRLQPPLPSSQMRQNTGGLLLRDRLRWRLAVSIRITVKYQSFNIQWAGYRKCLPPSLSNTSPRFWRQGLIWSNFQVSEHCTSQLLFPPLCLCLPSMPQSPKLFFNC